MVPNKKAFPQFFENVSENEKLLKGDRIEMLRVSPSVLNRPDRIESVETTERWV
ncbi:MAG: hypothetical protein K6C14_03345 [Eubacterium sp.]|nr:hypothetical protein [Eubacterium sp.]